MIDAKETRTDETRWSYRLSGEDLKAILQKALVEEICPQHRFASQGLSLVVSVDGGHKELPGVTFELIYDHKWVLRPPHVKD